MTELGLTELRVMDYAVARAIGCAVVGNDTAFYSSDRYAALDALQHYAWLRGYRSQIIQSESGETAVSLLQVGKAPYPLLRTAASATADRLETAVCTVICNDVRRRLALLERSQMETIVSSKGAE